ncbi:hypothetical protein FRB93_009613 [Tulasnella sp. JGI-2019a]|nr:hypothetical protein FRB93_009613 [Tulasnella sp. JGI-2019a]
MHMESPKVFFIGATGYIGGSILVAFVRGHPELTYSALVRNPKDIQAIANLNVRAIQGSTSDIPLIEKETSEHDIVVNCANADDLRLAEAVINGLTTRSSNPMKKGSRKPIYIHTSGTGVVKDRPTGAFQNGKIYDDYKEEDIRTIDPKQPHRNVDLLIFEAGKKGLIDTFIVAPSTIYGTGRGPVRNISQQVNGMIRIAVKNKQVLRVGAGTNVWDNVHINDLMDLYLRVLDLALLNIDIPGSPYERFFWGSAHTHIWGEVARDLAMLMYKRGLVDRDEVRSVNVEDEPDLIGVATNSRTIANRSLRMLGWMPTGKSLADMLEEEIDLTLSQL